MSHLTKSPLAAAVGAVVFGLVAQSVFAVGVSVHNADMETLSAGSLIDGRDVFPVNGANPPPAQDGWLNWANHNNGGYLRFWNPSTTNRWTGANNEFFDTSWGGNDASGNAAGNVLAIRTHSIDGAGGTSTELLDPYGNRTTAVPSTVATSTSPTGFTYTWATNLPTRDFEAAASRLSEAFDPTAKYTLSVKVGRLHADGFNTGVTNLPGADLTYGTGDDVAGASTRFAIDAPALFDGYRVDLMAGGVQGSGGNNGGWAFGTTANPAAGDYIGTIGSDVGGASSIAEDSWITSTVAYVPNPATQAAMNGLTGKNVVIRLAALENANHAYTSAAAFDDVVLTKVYAGDANEDDKIDLNDGGILVGSFGAASGKTWATGDFTGDGAVDLNDAGLLVSHFGEDYTAPAALLTTSNLTTGTANALWTYDDVVAGLSTQISVASTLQAFLATEALDGATLQLVQQAVPFSTPQTGPGTLVGEFMTSNFISGIELINITVPTDGIYTFNARWNVVGGNEQSAQFQIQFGNVPEPTSLAAIGLVGMIGLKRRRRSV